MKDRAQIAILASGEGTTAEAFILAGISDKTIPKVRLVISNNKNAGIFQRIERLNKQHKLNIECVYIGRDNYPAKPGEILKTGDQTKAEEAAILEKLVRSNVDLVVLMGYMKRVGKKLINKFGWRPEYTSPHQAIMLNTHPGLLPATKGMYGQSVQQHVIDRKLPASGQTLHVAAIAYDEGPTIIEHQVAVKPGDTAESLFERVRTAEKKYLPKDIANFIETRKQAANQL